MCFLPWKFSFKSFLDLDLWFRSSEISLSSMNSVLEFSGLHCCLIVKVQARQVFVQSFLKACFHKMFCAKDCCATALSEQCFSASCPCFFVASFRLCHPQRCILYHPPIGLSTLILKFFQIFFDKLRKH